MIHLILLGGLGNQMFEYAYALSVQKKNPNDFILINPVVLNHHSDGRSNSLHHFKLSKKVITVNKWQGYLWIFRFMMHLPYRFGIKNLIAKWRKQFRDNEQLCSIRVSRGLFFSSNSFGYMQPTYVPRSIKHLYAHFQDVRVLEGIVSQLKEQFEIVTPPSQVNQKMLEQIRSCNAVCLHVRRGDYLQSKWSFLQVCNYEYYAEAVKQAKAELETPRFFVFSTGHDDIRWIQENYQFDADITYVDLDNPDYEELRLMQACRHFIISNSTFSWWAAVLGDADDKRVWVPQVWKRGAEVNMYPDSWRKVHC